VRIWVADRRPTHRTHPSGGVPDPEVGQVLASLDKLTAKLDDVVAKLPT
jgi:hypothetical protein